MSLARWPLFGCVALAIGCGGSSSETPFPLEPDFSRERASSSPDRHVVFSGSEQQPEPGEEAEPLEEDDANGPARSTWGGRKRRTSPARPPPEPEPEIELEPE